MNLVSLAPVLILLPLGTAALLTGLSGRAVLARSVAVACICGQLLLVVVVYLGFEAPLSAFEASWLPALGTQVHLSVDGICVHALMVLAAVLAVAIVAEIRLQPGDGSAARLALIFFVVAAMNVFLMSRDLLVAAAAHGTAGLALAALLGVGSDLAGQSAARRFANWAIAGTLLLSTSAAILAAGAGSTVIDDLTRIAPGPARIAAPLLAAALAIQLPLVPLHTWLAPAAAAGTLAGRTLIFGAWCTAGAFGLLRFGLGLFPDLLSYAAPVPLLWGTATVVYAATLAIAQGEMDLTRRLSWATVGAGGLLLAGVSGLETHPVLGAWLYAGALALPRVGLLLLAYSITLTGARGGSVAGVWVVLALVLAAAPGTSLFPGWLLVVASTEPVVAGLLMVASAVLAYALLAPAIRLAGEPMGPALPISLSRLLAAVVVVALLTGLFPGPSATRAGPDIERLLARTARAADTATDMADPAATTEGDAP